MDRSTQITLITQTRMQDANGVWRKGNPTEKIVFAQVSSVTRAEFFAAGESGIKPEFRFTMLDAEYNGETTVLYNGVAYAVYRTYHARTDEIELYVQRKAGISVPTSTPTQPTTPETPTTPEAPETLVVTDG